MLKLEDFGFSVFQAAFLAEQNAGQADVGRVVAEHRERYIILTLQGELEAEITGNMRFAAGSRTDFPAVGDWVLLSVYNDDSALIHQIFPRRSVIARNAVGHQGEIQIIAANVDVAFIMQAADRDFNLNRFERYLTICYSSGVKPVILLSKTDLPGREVLEEMIRSIRTRLPEVDVIPVSNLNQDGYGTLKAILEPGMTYCLLGSSGVGKSTLLNGLLGEERMKTETISDHTNKGRHTTSHRELSLLEGGAVLIDNPGMREVGITGIETGLEATYSLLYNFSAQCRFKDCTHTVEKGCAVVEAVRDGRIPEEQYGNFLKLEKERIHFETTVWEKKRKEKIFGKIIKDYFNRDTNNR